MKKVLAIVAVLFIGLLLISCKNEGGKLTQDNNQEDVKAIEALVINFGSKLKEVSLLAPKDELEKSMKDNYGNFVSEELIKKWISDSKNAPGRLTSSPWPDRIEISVIEKLGENEYKVEGVIIEITSTEIETNNVAAKRLITLNVKRINNKWIIDDVILGEYDKNIE